MIKKRILVCLMLFLVTPFLFGCDNAQPHVNDAEGIAPAVALKLRKDYLKQLRSESPGEEISLEEIWVQEYFGTYSDCEIVFMGDPLYITFLERNVVVAGYLITFRDGKELYVHKGSRFYTVKEAYDAGYITKKDIEDFGPQVGVAFKEWEGEVFTSGGSLIVTPHVDAPQ